MAGRSQYPGDLLGSKNMFQLEREIANWKQSLSSDGIVGPEEALELESHLRESMASLIEKEMSEEEAFLLGVHRMGHPTALRQEYSKNNSASRWKHRLFWMIAGYLAVRVAGGSVSALATITGTAMAYSGFGGSTSGAAMISTTALAWVAILVITYLARNHFGQKSERLSRSWIIVIGTSLVALPAISLLGQMAQNQVVTTSWYGEAVIQLALGNIVLNVCIALSCFAAFCKLNGPTAWKFDAVASENS